MLTKQLALQDLSSKARQCSEPSSLTYAAPLRFESEVKDLAERRQAWWQRQLHLYEVPFYYIEYGIAQLGAIGVWRNYRRDPQAGLDGYKRALSLGYKAPIRTIYEAANVPFDFSADHINELMRFVWSEIEQL